MAKTTTPAELREEHYAAICDKNREVDRLHDDFLEAKAVQKEKKAVWDAAAAELHSLISRGPNDQLGLPFGEEDWRTRSIAVLGLSDAMVEKLAEAGIETLGNLKDYWDAGKYLTDIKGIGGEKSANISDAWAGYEKDHPEIHGEEGAAVEGDENDEEPSGAEGEDE